MWSECVYKADFKEPMCFLLLQHKTEHFELFSLFLTIYHPSLKKTINFSQNETITNNLQMCLYLGVFSLHPCGFVHAFT